MIKDMFVSCLSYIIYSQKVLNMAWMPFLSQLTHIYTAISLLSMKYNVFILKLMSLSPNKKKYSPHSIKFLKKDRGSNKDYVTIIKDIHKKQAFSYHSYLDAIQIWQREKLKRRIRAQSLASTFYAQRNTISQSVISDVYANDWKKQSETISHDWFPFQNSKKAIYRLKLNKNTLSLKQKCQKALLQPQIQDFGIMKKQISSRQKQSRKTSLNEQSPISNSTFYLLNRIKSKNKDPTMQKDLQTNQSINQISPW